MEEKKLFQQIELPSTLEGCHDLIRTLLGTISELFNRVEKLEIENRQLRERLNNNSSNSSLPPSRDNKKKNKKKNKSTSKNKSGGQAGHKGHFRKLLDINEVDSVINCELPTHCACSGEIISKEDYQRHQVYDLPKIKLYVTEYHLNKGYCCNCGRNHVATFPEGVTWGITGPKLTAFMSHLVSKYQMSRRELKEFLKEHLNFEISLGTVFNKQKIVNNALEVPTTELLVAIKQNPNINVDETGHNRDGKKHCLWAIASSTAAYFSIQVSRGKKALKSLIGDFNNFVISDRYVAYNHFDSSKRQICWAHLKRDFTKLSEKEDKIVARIGKKLLKCEFQLFEIWHQFKQNHITRDELMRQSNLIRRTVGELLEQGSYTDPSLRAARFCKNLLKEFDALWTFISVEGIEPTNNHAERCLRHSVTWRKKYFGTRSDYGSEYVARTASANMTCKLQGKNSFTYLWQSVQNYFIKIPAPALIN